MVMVPMMTLTMKMTIEIRTRTTVLADVRSYGI